MCERRDSFTGCSFIRLIQNSRLTFEGTAEFENTVYAIKYSCEYREDFFKKVKGEVTLPEDNCEEIRRYLRGEVLPLYPRDVHNRDKMSDGGGNKRVVNFINFNRHYF